MDKEKIPIQNLIFEIRGQKVMLDRDLAELYEIEVKRLNEAVKRNIERFPDDFMFQLTQEEWDNLRAQIVISSQDHLRSHIVIAKRGNLKLQNEVSGNGVLRSQTATANEKELWAQFMIANKSLSKIRFLPYVFTEQGVAMLSGVLSSKKAIDVNISIMRAFVRLRYYTISQPGTSEQIAELRHLLMLYIEKNDERVNDIIIALNNLIAEPPKPGKIGFSKD